MARGLALEQSADPVKIDPPAEMMARRPVPAWVMSVVLHAAVLLVFGLTIRVASPSGADVEPDRTGGIVLVKRSEGRQEYFDRSDETADRQASPDTAAPSTAAAMLPSPAELPVDFDGVLPAGGTSVGAGDVGGVLPDAGDLTTGTGPSKQIGGAAQTQVFGVQGVGHEFVYVFDRSGSMSGFGGRPLRAAKRELIASLQDLGKLHQFQIIFYNQTPKIFNPTGGTPQLFWGSDPNKQMAEQFVQGIVADGSTRHMFALSMALKMRPDVIFFLTDAEDPQMTEDELAQVGRLNVGRETVINAIQFGFGPYDGEDNFLKRLARENRGQWAYQDISKLPD
jgi:hypothetical protein